MDVASRDDVGTRTSIVALPIEESLSLIPFHSSIPEIDRLVFPGIPHLVSVHRISRADTDRRDYCRPHVHLDEDELNVFLGTSDDFRFRITVGGSERIVGPIAALLIPAGETHAANVISGSGYYLVFKVSPDQR